MLLRNRVIQLVIQLVSLQVQVKAVKSYSRSKIYLIWIGGLVKNLLVVDYFVGGYYKLWLGVPLVVGDIIPKKLQWSDTNQFIL